MTREDGAVQAMLDDLHPFGTVERGGRTVAAWVAAREVDGTGTWHPATTVMGVTGDGTPFGATRREVDGPVAAETALASPGKAHPRDWMSCLARWRDEGRVAKRILAGARPRHIPTKLREYAISVERHASSVEGIDAKLAQGSHAVLRRLAGVEAHARSILAPDLALFALGKETALHHLSEWFQTFRGPLLDACNAEPQAWQSMTKYATKDPDRFAALAGAGRYDTLAHEALLADGLTPALARRAREASDALLGLAESADDPFLGDYLPHHADVGSNREVAEGLRELGDYPPNWIPAGPENWRTALVVVPFLSRAKAVKQARNDPSVLPTLVDVGGDWVGYRDRLLKAARVHDLDGIVASIKGLDDMCEAFRDQVVDPALALVTGLGPRAGVEDTSRDVPRRQRTRLAHAMLLSGRNLAGMLDVGAAWHATQDAVDDGLRFGPHGVADSALGWRATFPDATFHDVHVTVLTSRAQLKAEGGAGPDADGVMGLDHCVTNYAGRCLTEGIRVASVRRALPDGGFERLATAELRMFGREAVVTQLRGRSNATPPRDAERAMAAYLNAIRAGVAKVEQAGPRHGGKAPNVAVACGYRWWEEGAWEQAMGLWTPRLRRSLRDMDAATVVASLRRDAGLDDGRWWKPEPYEPAEAGPAPSPGP